MVWEIFEERISHHTLQEEDVVGVMPSKDFAALLPLGDRVLIEVPSPPHEPAPCISQMECCSISATGGMFS